MNTIKRILFIAHNTSVSGASLVLLNFATWMKAHHRNIEIDVLFADKGQHQDEYEKVFDKHFYINEFNNRLSSKIYKAFKRRMGITAEKSLLKKILQNKYDIIYCNTILTLYWGITLKIQSASKLVVHVHELNTVIKTCVPNLADSISYVDKFICASQAVADNLLKYYNVEKKKLSVVYEFINSTVLQKTEKLSSAEFIVGSSGFLDWRKGYDILILIAYGFRKKYPDIKIRFLWFGSASRETKIIIEEDLRKMNLQDVVQFPGLTLNPLEEYRQFDIFLLTSREDPFPLVCIEAGRLGKPIICFKDAGGICELIKNGGGTIVPYLDIDSAIEEIFMYVRDEQKLKADSDYIKMKTLEFNTEKKAPEIYEIIKKLPD